MSRKRRVWHPDSFYHVVSRGNRRDPLFQDEKDFRVFFYNMRELYEQTPFEISSFCFMTNHYHMQLRSREVPISKIMSFINKRYANYYNTRYNLCGHVFEKRFFAEVVSGTYGNFILSHYIHMNPVRANITERPEHYRWSSYQYFHSSTKSKSTLKIHPYFNPTANLELFKGSKKNYLKAFDSLNQTRVNITSDAKPSDSKKIYYYTGTPKITTKSDASISDMQIRIGNHVYL